MANPLDPSVKHLPGLENILVVVPTTGTAGGVFAGQVAEIMSNQYGCKAVINEKFSSDMLSTNDLSSLDQNSEAFTEFLKPILNIIRGYTEDKEWCILVILESLKSDVFSSMQTACRDSTMPIKSSALFVNGDTFSDNSNKTVDFDSANISFNDNSLGITILQAKPKDLNTENSFRYYLGESPVELNQISNLDGYRFCKSLKIYFSEEFTTTLLVDDFAFVITEKCKFLLDSLCGNIHTPSTGNSYALHKSRRIAQAKSAKQTLQKTLTPIATKRKITQPSSTHENFEAERIYQENIVDNANAVIGTGLHHELQYFIKERFRSNHFGPDAQSNLLLLSNSIERNEANDSFDLLKAAQEYEKFDSLFDSLQKKDEAFYAYTSIILGKILNSFAKILKRKQSLLSTEISKKDLQTKFEGLLFKNPISAEAKRYRMKIAQIPSVERWFFLGITRLMQLQPLVQQINTNDPIGTLLGSAAYKFTLENSSNEDFAFMFKKHLNTEMLRSVCHAGYDAPLEQLTNAFQKPISAKTAKQIINGVNKGASFHSVVQTLTAKSDPNTQAGTTYVEVDLSPSWNLFDETCLKLQEMMEEILLNKIVPDYPPFITSPALKSLISLANDLEEFWGKDWKGYNS